MPATTPIQGFPYPVAGDSADVPRDVGALATKLDPLGYVPVGAMFMWPAAAAPVENDAGGNALWLLMLGQVVLATTYPKLATVLGQAGGNVTVPDMRALFPVGSGTGYPLLQGGGVASVTLTDRQSGTRAHNHSGLTAGRDRSQNHAHPASDTGGYFALYLGGGGIVYYSAFAGNGDPRPGNAQTGAADPTDHYHYIGTEAAAWALDAHENRPPFKAVNFIIRAG
jgi:microcystin-dependent protein